MLEFGQTIRIRMDIRNLETLNTNQLEAVKSIDGSLLILAGAGSGKTKTITTRLAYLIDEIGIDPKNTLTLTFTNKAASEMQTRALNMIDSVGIAPLLCTFHKFGLLFLKSNIKYLNRSNNFYVLDSDDVRSILKKLNNEVSGIDIPIKKIASIISNYKNSEISVEQAIKDSNSLNGNSKYIEESIKISNIYKIYQDILHDKNIVDFDDLLLLPLKIMQDFKDVAINLSNHYQYIMVDEFQDTNVIQYKLLKQLCKSHNNLCVVGDDDQSIYSWRGANIDNILNFTKDFNAKEIKLEENYRSTNNILTAANLLISENKKRLGKTLKSTIGDGEKVEVINLASERDESYDVSKKISKLINNGVKPSDIAVLFRLNALSRSLEEAFNKDRIPYVLVGTIAFYERKEIKDIISYFRMLVDLNDDISLFRIINTPKRSIGKSTIEKLEILSKQNKCSVYQLIKNDIDLGLKPNTIKEIKKLFATLEELRNSFEKYTCDEFLDSFEEKIGYMDSLKNSNDDIDRISNANEFFGLYRDYFKENTNDDIADFLNDLALRSEQENAELKNKIDSVSCMSVHSSKGLEFDYVFIIGLENGFFPLNKEDTDLEEERRLAYVAFTRAKKKLYLYHADSRLYFGKRSYDIKASIFLKDSGLINNNPESIVHANNEFKKGCCVKHKILGYGRIIEVNNDKIKVNFGGSIKELRKEFLELT